MQIFLAFFEINYDEDEVLPGRPAYLLPDGSLNVQDVIDSARVIGRIRRTDTYEGCT